MDSAKEKTMNASETVLTGFARYKDAITTIPVAITFVSSCAAS